MNPVLDLIIPVTRLYLVFFLYVFALRVKKRRDRRITVMLYLAIKKALVPIRNFIEYGQDVKVFGRMEGDIDIYKWQGNLRKTRRNVLEAKFIERHYKTA